MADRDNPEYIAFQRCNVILQDLNHGLEPILDRAFAKELIKDVLKKKCLDKTHSSEDRTRWFITAIQDRIKCLPDTFHTFVKILQQDIGDYIGNELLKKLAEVKKDLESAHVQQASESFTGVLIPAHPSMQFLPNMVAGERRMGLLTSHLQNLELLGSSVSSFKKQAGARASTPPPLPTVTVPELSLRTR